MISALISPQSLNTHAALLESTHIEAGEVVEAELLHHFGAGGHEGRVRAQHALPRLHEAVPWDGRVAVAERRAVRRARGCGGCTDKTLMYMTQHTLLII